MIKTTTVLLEFQSGPTRAALMKAGKPETSVCGLESITIQGCMMVYVLNY